MPSKNKLIKQGIKYTDSLFDEISKRLEKGVKASDTLEAFLEKTAGYTSGNPLVESGYYDKMMKLILQETNNHKFSRPAQKELVRLTIENRVGELIVDVGEDIRDNVRDIVRDGYNSNLSQDEIATNISEKVSSIKGKRAKAIARTEIARTATVSDYIINKERGATHFYVECRNTACPVCKEAWHKHWSKANDDSFKPKDQSAGGKGWIGDRTYSMKDTTMLPPIHVNCRCVPYFISEDEIEDGMTVVKTESEPTPTTTTSVEERPTNSMFKGKYTEHIEDSDFTEGKVIVRKYENGLELAVNENSNFTHEEIIAHIESLPEPIKNLENIGRINFTNSISLESDGDYVSGRGINVYDGDLSDVTALNTLTHELAHAFDHSKGNDETFYGLSDKKVYEKIFKADNDPTVYINPSTGEERTFDSFVTGYAQYGFNKTGKFTEDFAESTRLYLNPATHDKFVKDFPNRAKYLESLYGKPKFDKNSPLYKALKKEGKI